MKTKPLLIQHGHIVDPSQGIDKISNLLISEGRIPVVLGGDHSVSIGAIRAAAREHAGLSVLQIDAHAD
ncbi:MAG: arginase family protein, partial [Dehalococcoidales bacterium]|nr:arginase family protein [Dehalococcoidales bacterium]